MRLVEVLEWDIGFPVVLVVQHIMAMAEGAALAILAGQANGSAFRQDRGKGQRFGLPPINAALCAQRRRAPLEQTRQFGIGRETLRPRQ